MSAVLIWLIVLGAIAGVIFRPKEWPEAVWACLGALLLVILRLVPPSRALAGAAKGTDVYLFLTGMMLLSELARQEGVFDWLASHAVKAAGGSHARLFTLVYAVGILVTVFLSNDATAVVLTPAVYAAVKRARAQALPYLFICAFIANAASFVLPISNPANLVVFGRTLPALLPWLRFFGLPSLLAIIATYIVLWLCSRRHLHGRFDMEDRAASLSVQGKRAAWGIVVTAVVLLCASFRGIDLGLPTCLAAVAAVLLATQAEKRALRSILAGVSWAVLPLVAGLFVMVEALDAAGALESIRGVLRQLAALPSVAGSLATSFGIAALSNVMNNLPSGLLTGGALQSGRFPDHLRRALLIGVDLGPNLSVTGSLATVLWLIALRREGEQVSGWTFFKTGMIVMPPALILATLAVSAIK